MNLPVDNLLVPFFQEASRRMEDCTIKNPLSRDEVRQLLLKIQTECLASIVSAFNESQSNSPPLSMEYVQRELKQIPRTNSRGRIEMEQMNEAARLAYCRLVLHSECQRELSHCRQCHSTDESGGRSERLKRTGRMDRDDILEFIALCEVAVKLPNVLQHLGGANRASHDPTADCLFLDLPLPPTSIFPQKRLEFIQRLLLRAIGYDSTHGYNEIKRIFFSSNTNEFADDVELMTLFAKMSSHMDVAITNATLQATSDVFLSDHDQGGCTRVVSVKYSEIVVDPSSGQEMADESSGSATESFPPTSQRMEQQRENIQTQQHHLAKESAKLHQEILGQLFTMRDEDRDATLAQAKSAAIDFTERLASIEDPKDRISFLESLDDKTQRLLIIDKIWSSMLAENGGQPPKMHL